MEIHIPTEPFITLSEQECAAIVVALLLMAFDIVAGLLGAVVRQDYQSGKMREGLGHKAMIVLVMCLAVIIEGATALIGDLGFTVPLVIPVCCYVIVMEVGSVLETVAKAYPELATSKIFSFFANSTVESVDESSEGTDDEG